MIKQNASNVFHLQTKKTSYIFRALPTGQLESLYYGRKIRETEDYTFLYDKHIAGYSNSTPYCQDDTTLSLDHIALEYSAYGKGDYRLPSMQLTAHDGVFTTDFKYKSAAITKLKPELKGLPSSYGESDTLTVVLEDAALGAELHLIYTVFEDCNVITRSTRLINKSKKTIKIPHSKYVKSCRYDKTLFLRSMFLSIAVVSILFFRCINRPPWCSFYSNCLLYTI